MWSNLFIFLYSICVCVWYVLLKNLCFVLQQKRYYKNIFKVFPFTLQSFIHLEWIFLLCRNTTYFNCNPQIVWLYFCLCCTCTTLLFFLVLSHCPVSPTLILNIHTLSHMLALTYSDHLSHNNVDVISDLQVMWLGPHCITAQSLEIESEWKPIWEMPEFCCFWPLVTADLGGAHPSHLVCWCPDSLLLIRKGDVIDAMPEKHFQCIWTKLIDFV